MPRAIWNKQVIAESSNTEMVEGNHYFPPDSVHHEYLVASDTTSKCPWKGTAHYYHVFVDGERNSDAAWYYPAPKAEARHIRNYVAFWKGVFVED